MNIQPISFNGINDYNNKIAQTSPINQDNKISKVNEKEYLESMIKQAQSTMSATGDIQNASNHFKKESMDILYNADKIQQKSQKIMGEIIDTSSFQEYLKDKRVHQLYGSYITKVEVDNETYDVIIGKNSIRASKKEGDGKDVFVFNPSDRELSAFYKNQRRFGAYVTASDAVYNFDEKTLNSCDIGVSNAESSLISKSFKYDTEKGKTTLRSVSIMKQTSLEKETAQRVFEYDNDGNLKKYLRGFEDDMKDRIKAQLYYEFDNQDLISFAKDAKYDIQDMSAKLLVEYNGENNFYVMSDYDSDETFGYSAIVFYQNGQITGSIRNL